MEFKKRVLNLLAYYLQVNESKMKTVKGQREYYGAKVALLRDIYDDIKAMQIEGGNKNGCKRNRTCK